MTMTTLGFGWSVDLIVHVVTVTLRMAVILMKLLRLVIFVVGVASRWWLILGTGLEVVWVLRLEMGERLWGLGEVGVAEDLGRRRRLRV